MAGLNFSEEKKEWVDLEEGKVLEGLGGEEKEGESCD